MASIYGIMLQDDCSLLDQSIRIRDVKFVFFLNLNFDC